MDIENNIKEYIEKQKIKNKPLNSLDIIVDSIKKDQNLTYKIIEARSIDKLLNLGIDFDINTLKKIRNKLINNTLKNIINNCSGRIYVIGHPNPDVDSIFSSYLLSKVLKSFGVDAKFAILKGYKYLDSSSKIIKDYLNEKPIVVEPKDNKFILVDHNQLYKLKKSNVVGAIDHHRITKEIDNVLEIEYASTGLLIYNLFKNKYNFNEEDKILVALTVLTDTEYLNSPRYTKQDKLIYESLNLNLDSKALEKKYFVTTNFNKSITDNIKDSIKTYKYNNLNINRVLILSYHNDLINNLDNYINVINNYEGNWLIIWCDYELKSTIIIYNGDRYELDYVTTSTNIVLKYLDKLGVLEKKIYKK